MKYPLISFCILHSAFCISLFAADAPAAKSAYVPLLKPGEVFAPVEANGAGVEPIADTEFVFPAAYVEDFEIDGDMEKHVWRKAKPVDALYPIRSDKPIPYRNDIRMLWSKTALYVGATLWQDMTNMVCKWDQRDQAIWNDDNLEIFLFIRSKGVNRIHQYVINPLGTVADLRDGNIAYWTRGMKQKAVRHGDRWTFEWKFPFSGIPMDRPMAGDFIGVRFCRTVHQPSGVGTAPVLLSPGHGQRGRFAKLLFSQPEGEGAERLIAEGEVYRQETQRRRFTEQFTAEKKRFEEVKGCAAAFAQSTHPLHVHAWDGIRQMEKALADFEGKFGADLATEREIPEEEGKRILSMFAGFASFASRNAYAVWQTDPWEVGSPEDLPPTNALTMPPPLLFEQGGNEREQICLNLHGLLCGARLDLRLWPETTNEKGRPYLRTDSVEIYTEPFVRMEGSLLTAPLVRAAGNVVTVSPGQTARVWVVFNSRGVKAGRYDTTLTFKSMHDLRVADRSLPLGATVWRFDLPETRDWPLKSFFWGPFEFNEDEVALMELTHDHHVTHAWTQHHRYQYGMKEERDRGYYTKKERKGVPEGRDYADDVALHGNEAFLRRAKELGMRFVIGWGTPSSLDWFKTMTKRFLDMGFEYEDFVYKGLIADEFSRMQIPTCAAAREAVWNWNTNLWFQAVYLSTPPPTGATMDDIEEAKLPEFYKMWTVIRGRCRDPKEGPDTIGRLKAKGCKVWSYNCQRFMQVRPILSYYRFYPWECRLMDLDGCAMWTVYSPNGDGWDSRDGYDDGACWRGLDRKPIPTKRFEAFREGLEDVAYMDRLEREIERLTPSISVEGQKSKVEGLSAAGTKPGPPGATNSSLASLIAEARRLLDEREEIVKAEDQKRVDAWRLSVGRLIDAMAAQ